MPKAALSRAAPSVSAMTASSWLPAWANPWRSPVITLMPTPWAVAEAKDSTSPSQARTSVSAEWTSTTSICSPGRARATT